MGIKTEDMVSYLPPKEITEGVDWLGILDSFDPSILYQRYIDECARRNPYDTCYRWDTPARPVAERLEHSDHFVKFRRRDLEDCVKRIETEGLSAVAYRNARAALIRAIGAKGAAEYNRREYDRLGEEGRRLQEAEYRRWEKEWEEQTAQREAEGYWSCCYDGYYQASVHEKVVRIRKGLKGSNGKPLTQRDFAKFLGYPVNKYAEAEKTDRYGIDWETEESAVEDELLEKLVMIAHANPYWLFDSSVEADFAEYDPESYSVCEGDQPCVYAAPDVILKWINEGKPKETDWFDGVQ